MENKHSRCLERRRTDDYNKPQVAGGDRDREAADGGHAGVSAGAVPARAAWQVRHHCVRAAVIS